MIELTEKIPSGSQKILVNPDSIERILPATVGSVVTFMSGSDCEVLEHPQQIAALIAGSR